MFKYWSGLQKCFLSKADSLFPGLTILIVREVLIDSTEKNIYFRKESSYILRHIVFR